jgi:hypothetical protein
MRGYLLASLLFAAANAFGQVDVSSVSGTIKDPTGAAVPGATIEVSNTSNGSLYKASSSEKGEYTVPALPAGVYRISVTKTGFKAEKILNVELLVGVPAQVDVALQVGQTSDTVEVTAAANILQTETADVSTNISGRQLTELPFATRNAIELLVDAPGTSTPSTPRSSTINGMPKGAINITIDGMNTQDNNLKSSDGYFSYIYPSVDALEEVTLQTSGAGVDSTAQGGAQIKFVTRSGTNKWKGGVFWQDRNTAFNANYFFNQQVGLPRDIVKLNQMGGHIGGPIIKNKLFFFGNSEFYRFPGTNIYSRTYLTPSAASGVFTYADTGGAIHNVNLLALAGSNPAPAGTRAYSTTVDPIFAKTYAAEASLSAAGGIVKPNITSGDYNTNAVSYQPNGTDSRDFYTSRIDYNITQKHQLSFVYNYDKYVSAPDFLNNVVPAFPGTGTVLFSNVNTGQRSNRFDGTFSLRSSIKPSLTNEFRAGLNGGTLLFFDAVAPGLFSPWRGYVPAFANPGTALSNVQTTSSPQRRNAPVKNIGDTVTWVHGTHQVSFGFNWDQINLYQQVEGSALFPTATLGIASGDPIFTGTTSIFTASTLPGASSAQLSSAANLYADITGRVSSITQSVALDELSRKYGATAPIDRDRLREFGLFIADQWRVRRDLTITAGLRMEKQLAFVNQDNLYTSVAYAGLWGVSGVGNLFKPGTLTGSAPVYNQINGASPYSPGAVWAPSFGVAYQLPKMSGLARIFTGDHDGASVIRGGYAIATVREGMNVYRSLFGLNQGLTVDDSVSPSTYPAIFGAAGSVNFSDANLPSRTSTLSPTPVYPLQACFTCSVNGFTPNLGTGYVQSWNLSYQRELDRSTVVDFRYTGNHGTKLWRQYNLNEVNIFENGFLNQFQIAQKNLTIARGGNITNQTSNNFGNQGLPGQQNVPILTTAIGTSTDSTTATYLMLGQAGTSANSIATNQTRMNALVAAGYPVNLFQVNPTVANGGAFVLTNNGASFYNAFQMEVRRRISKGLTVQGSYVYAKAEANGATGSSSDTLQPTTLRNLGNDRIVEGFDIRNAIKLNGIYELPFGTGRAFGANVHNIVARSLISGWQVSGVMRFQSGTPIFLQGLGTFSQVTSASGVVLHNITADQLQSMIGVYKSNIQGANGGIVFYLPPPTTLSASGVTSATNNNLITNTLAAYNLGGFNPGQVNPNAPYISPAPAGQLGWQGQFYLPWQKHADLAIQKNTKIGEKLELQIGARFLDAFNITNFLPTASTNSASFGQTTAAYRDISGTVDPGARIIEFLIRINF